MIVSFESIRPNETVWLFEPVGPNETIESSEQVSEIRQLDHWTWLRQMRQFVILAN